MKSTQGLVWCLAVAAVVFFASVECGARNYNPYESRNLSAGHRKNGNSLNGLVPSCCSCSALRYWEMWWRNYNPYGSRNLSEGHGKYGDSPHRSGFVLSCCSYRALHNWEMWWRNYSPYGSRNITAGHRKYGDRLLYYTQETAKGEFMRVVSKDVVYRPTVRGANTTITYYQVIDMYNNGNGGYVFNTSGGIGFSNVGFHFQSKRNHGYDFYMMIFGYPNQTHY